ncbi:hypothetical protein BKE38_12610 [Pseudoroseomonas deserti]|uniref:Uncharacterized protein n=1 Tax=Teichococcus deserti TaxID=1817963 RepID=A0A1V2H2L4_9PROT|nr:hypothetical protein [Pseudoroseomonas deserti]ONG53297.1 hypothetical protein BKE38_12610 [Pseudoroseomonas deserti]
MLEPAQGNTILVQALSDLTGFHSSWGHTSPWRAGVAAAYVRHLVRLRPERDLPAECRASFEALMQKLDAAAQRLPGFRPESFGAAEDLSLVLLEDEAAELANDIIRLRHSALKAQSPWRG